MIRLLVAAALVAGAAVAVPARPAAAGPMSPGVFVGWYDTDTFLAGGGLRIGLGTITLNPNAEWYDIQSATAWSLNADATMTVIPAAVASGWVGAGLGWRRIDFDNAGSSDDTVVNLLAGAGLNAFPLKPYAQYKYVIGDGDDVSVITLGVRF